MRGLFAKIGVGLMAAVVFVTVIAVGSMFGMMIGDTGDESNDY